MHSNSTIHIPKFKPSLRIEPIDSDVLLILSECKRSIISGRGIVLVAQTIDGHRSVEEIASALSDRLSGIEVLHALNQLTEKGHIVTAEAAATESLVAFWDLIAGDGAMALKNLANAAVSVESVGGLSCAPLTQALGLSRVRVARQAQLRIILADDYDRPELEQIGRQATVENAALLLVKPCGVNPAIGPLIQAQSGACLACLKFWIGINHPVERFVSRLQGDAGCRLPLSTAGAGEQAVYGLTALAVANLFATREDRASLHDSLLAINLHSLQTSSHRIVKRPQCPHCGDPELMRKQAARFPELQSIRQLYCKDGGYRKRDPVQTFEQYKHLISPVTGPISYLHPMPGRHAGMRKVYVSGYMVCPQDTPRGNSFDKICAGKGQTDEQARASALCEALERYSGVYQGDEATLRSSFSALGEQAIHFNALQDFSDWQYENREQINALTEDRRKQVPPRFDENAPIDWTPAWSLGTGRKHYLPLAYCYAETPKQGGSKFGIHNPNGAAAGNCLEEAILQGFLELVERDATAIWWYNRIERPGIDLASFGDPYFDSLSLHYAEMGWELWVLDLTHDLGIPACAALAYHAGSERYAIGFGCHLNAHLAVQRALTEVNQLFDPKGDSPSPWDVAKLGPARFLFPSTDAPARLATQLTSVGGIDLKSDIDHCIGVLADAGLEMLVVDKTRPDIGLSVVQVVVPGLRHFWPRFGTGRLYSVPLALGWINAATDEKHLNPAPLFL